MFIIYRKKIIPADGMISARHQEPKWDTPPILGKSNIMGWHWCEITDPKQLNAEFETMAEISKSQKNGLDLYFDEDVSEHQEQDKKEAKLLILELQLTDAKSNAICEINDKVGVARAKLITPIYGQQEVYREKSEEATDYVAAGQPDDLGNYPFIRADSAATGRSPADVARSILTARAKWIAGAALIEEHRLFGTHGIMKANDENGIIEILEETTSRINDI